MHRAAPLQLDYTGCLAERVCGAGFSRAEVRRGARGAAAALRRLRRHCWTAPLHRNVGVLGAVLLHRFAIRRGRAIQGLMPYADALVHLADWYRQLWAESLGKRVDRRGRVVETGQTPVTSLGATDQHSQVQLYVEGPHDKVVTFLFEFQTALSGELYGIDAFDQPGVEAGKLAAYALMGRKGFEKEARRLGRDLVRRRAMV